MASDYGKIDRRLNIVIEVERAAGGSIHVHSVPVPKEVYDSHWEVMHHSLNTMYMERYLPPMCVRVGMRYLLKSATALGVRDAVEKDFLPHIWRQTSIITNRGVVPFDVAIASNDVLDPDDAQEVKEYLAYFISASWVHPKRELGGMLYKMLDDSGALFGLWSATEFATLLQTLKEKENTGEKPPPLLVPR